MSKARWSLAAVVCVLTLGLSVGLSGAQEKKEGAKPDDPKVKATLPDHFGGIGLTEKQKDDVRKAALPFDEKVSQLRIQVKELEKQIRDQETAKLAACEKLLTDVQRASLKELRETVAAEKAAKAKSKKTGNGDGEKKEEKKP